MYKKGYGDIPRYTVSEARKIFSDNYQGQHINEVTLELNNQRIQAGLFLPSSLESRTLIIFLHGGGYVFRNITTNSKFCSALSKEIDAYVLMPHYALSPEHKFPYAINQVKSLIKNIKAGNVELGGRNFTRIVLCGESSGGNLAASIVGSMEKDFVSGVILISPSLDYSNEYKTKQMYAEGMLLDRPVRDWFADKYLSSGEEKGDPRVSPANLEKLSQFDNTLIIASRYDPLYSEAFNFYSRLKQSAYVSFEEYPTFHGFMTAMLNPYYENAMSKIKHYITTNL